MLMALRAHAEPVLHTLPRLKAMQLKSLLLWGCVMQVVIVSKQHLPAIVFTTVESWARDFRRPEPTQVGGFSDLT